MLLRVNIMACVFTAESVSPQAADQVDTASRAVWRCPAQARASGPLTHRAQSSANIEYSTLSGQVWKMSFNIRENSVGLRTEP